MQKKFHERLLLVLLYFEGKICMNIAYHHLSLHSLKRLTVDNLIVDNFYENKLFNLMNLIYY